MASIVNAQFATDALAGAVPMARMKTFVIYAVVNHQNLALGNAIGLDQFTFSLFAHGNDGAAPARTELASLYGQCEAVIRTQSIPQPSPRSAVSLHLFDKNLVWPAATAKEILFYQAIEAYDHVTIETPDKKRGENSESEQT